METPSSFSNLYSHPGKPLEVHLINVARFSEFFLQEKPQDIQLKLTPIVKTIGLAHDIGKATKSFQNYLLAENDKVCKKRTTHSLLSAICAYNLVKEIKPSNEFYPLFAYIAVRRHHGDLIDIMDEITLIDDKEIDNLLIQVEDIEDGAFQKLIEVLLSHELPIPINKKLLKQWIENFREELRSYKPLLRKSRDIENYLTLNLIYSILLDADKSEAVFGDIRNFERLDYNEAEWVEKYLSNFTVTKDYINSLRNKAFREVNYSKIDDSKHFFTINLPTGLGKTLIGFAFALKLRNFAKLSNRKPRIIYSLPFLSIIDQNSKVLEEVISKNEVIPTSNLLLKHHHLTEIYYKTKETEYTSDEAKFLIEGWNSEIIVTTFVQLFHTLLSNKNATLRKFHRLANSIIILDEIQAIPIKYWKVISGLLSAISRILNTRVIVMTATDPLIFKGVEVSPVISSKQHFYQLHRTQIQPNLKKPLTLEELKDEFLKESGKGNKTLLIFNTISSAKHFYSLIQELPYTKAFLSTHVIPKERFRRIKEMKEGKFDVVVSTQLVEAGVDLDFDLVIRDIAPLDSIIQSAGRCNRNAKLDVGIVKVFKLIDEKGRPFALRVYDPVLIDITERILSKKDVFSEMEIYEFLNDYYELVENKMNQIESQQILEAVLRLRYESADPEEPSISKFQLIEEDYPKIDVFIEYDEDAKRVWKEFTEIMETKDYLERHRKFLEIRKDFYDYVISVPRNTQNLPPLINNTYYVPFTQLNDYYDIVTGFKTDTEAIIW
uniref:CRISPR-associated helicase Cas3 n=1 Tax=candidate division WOR-3 bacterium TaxID=2052148 RepID=A0A7C2K4C3_UNCW3